MITKLSHPTVWVTDQDEALALSGGGLGGRQPPGRSPDTLGFEVRADHTMDDFRWLAVGPAGQPDLQIVLMVPGPPAMPPETGEQIKQLVSSGAIGSGVFDTDDCRATYETLKQRGVEFLREPEERFYGIEALFRDPFGNGFSLTERKGR